MSTTSISIAKESSVQGINERIGESTDPAGSGTDDSLFAKTTAGADLSDTLNGRLTETVMSKADGIGASTDTGDTTIFGLEAQIKNTLGSNEIKEYMVTSTTVSGNETLIGTFTVPYTRIYTFYGELKAGASGSTNAAKVVLARSEISSAAEGELLMSVTGTTAAPRTANAYLEADVTYWLYLFGGGTPQLNQLYMTYYGKPEGVSTNYILASDNPQSRPVLDNSSGSGSTQTRVLKLKMKMPGSIRLKITKTASTSLYVYQNNNVYYSNITSSTDISTDIVFGQGDVLEVKACNTGSGDWSLSSFTFNYDVRQVASMLG